MTEKIRITYQLDAERDEITKLARKIAIEQSVETPESQISSEIERDYVGQLTQINSVPGQANSYQIELQFPETVVSDQFNQLLNLCFGNVSIYQNVRLIDIDIPVELLNKFAGPKFGVPGVRKKLGVFGRPLLATALKPRGQSNEYFAKLAYEFACGGGDIIKDDQNLIGSYEEFKRRTELCINSLKEAEQKTGRTCFYFPFISAPFEELEKHFEWIVSIGAQGVLLCPLIIGLDTARALASKYELIYMAHPSFTGGYCMHSSQGMSYELLYGLLYRLAGVDISVYPNTGGRFSFSEDDCINIANKLREPLGLIEKSFPCPAGGMHYEDLETMGKWYGEEAVFLLGGSLLEYSSSIENSTSQFKMKINEQFNEKIKTPSISNSSSSCEINHVDNSVSTPFLQFNDFEWDGRSSAIYKDSTEQSFRGVRRVELIGKNNEKSTFDLRYFEIEPGGYSSLEKHIHTHVIIIARGKGEVAIDNMRYAVAEHDIIYIKPLAIHQLINESSNPFGFYCIVDRERDKPIVPN